MLQPQKISVIGGSGFIGTRLCKRFTQSSTDFEIIDKVVSKTFTDKTALADVRNYSELFQAVTGDVLINLAAEHRDNVTPISLYDEVNVMGAKRVCEIAEAKNIQRIIFTSSVAVYGFAPINTDESGEINYFNDYGRTKYEAEQVFRSWQSKDPSNRALTILRPTVVFGEQNRGNVYNLLNQIASGRFMMVGNGENVKSMAYVENIAALLQYSINFEAGVHLYNYIDKPDLDMNTLVNLVYKILDKSSKLNIKIPYSMGLLLGKSLDFVSVLSGKKFPISAIRVKKFCSNTAFSSNIEKSGFIPPVDLKTGIVNTVKYEFVDQHQGELFYTE
ncbi:NAD-dependent epimerase/dehydratase family protein [Algoriphagus hitonicola]|uniref:Nucleoside-diphosphate-sugar epimerase n=1 Tax=Algoriphagus hitonicola TaxID=435880 RepID=A0A1I2X4E0_9BACT|nr:NAD-dependent epimerase/dehydratase family protein [Algoriphagus hitonicola]SFH08395.1 Nucleoside-diphosphate-sugar epimerase [Algoriphagus hitonicola]